jgi:Domain of unknown function (DUF4279)
MYDDDYPTCEETHATLRIYPGDIEPQTITERLRIEPSHWQRCGEVPSGTKSKRPAKINGWFLGSKGHIQSRDSRRHIDWILDQIFPKAGAIHALQELGCRIDISCYWISKDGHGGPTISPSQMKRLGELNIELWFDIYGPYDDENAQPGVRADASRAKRRST